MITSNSKTKKEGGFLVLTMVLLVSATVLIIATGSLLRAIGQANEGADSENSLKAWSAANACGEYALNQLSTTTGGRAGWSYGGDQSLPVGSQTCYIYPIGSGSDGSKLIQAYSAVSSFTRKVLIEAATNTPSLVINSWENVADF